jgi:4-amino-4-deoxy-L-arabinose transferase
VEHIQRFAGEEAQHASPFWYYIPFFAVAAIPWLGFLPGALAQGWQKRLSRPELFFLLSWLVMPFLFFSSAKGKLVTYILPCMAPLALLMAAYVRDGASSLAIFRANGVINMALAAVLMAVIANIVFGWIPLGVELTDREWYKPLAGVALAAACGVLGLLSLYRPARYWLLAAAYSLLFFWGYVFLLPDAMAQSKQPQIFIREHLAELQDSRYVMTNELGVATGLAWELRRSDIFLYNRCGELAYGIAHAEKEGLRPMIYAHEFAAWLEEVRLEGNSALLIRSSKATEDWLAILPPPDTVHRTGRHILLIYNQH